MLKLLSRQTARLVCYALLTVAICACSALSGTKPLAPTVKVAAVDIIKLGLKQQELAFTLDVFNPNGFDLPVNLLEFTATSDAMALASGRTIERVRLPAKQNIEVTVNVTTRANRLLGQLIASALNNENTLDYSIEGFVKLDNWPTRIPFDVNKTLSLDDL